MTTPVIETPRLILRKIADGDAELQFQSINTPTVMAHLGGVKTLDEIRAKHEKSRALFEQVGFGFMMLVEKSSGELIGHCGMKTVDNPLAPNLGDHEIGWLVREDRWRRGFAEEAVCGVIDWAFDTIGAPHLVALTSSANRASWGLMEKLGMERRADLDFSDPDYPPQDNPTIQYSLTKAQWEKRP